MNQPDNEENRLWTKNFILTTLSNLFLFFSFHLLTPTLPIYVVEMGGGKLAAGLVVGIFTLTAILIRPFAGRALDVMGRKKVLYFGLLIFLAAALSYEWIVAVSIILIVRTFQGIGWGISTTSYSTTVSYFITPGRRVEGMGYFGLSINMAIACAPLLGIWVMVEFGFTEVFILAGFSILIASLLSHFIVFPPPAEETTAKRGAILEKSILLPAILAMLVTMAHGGILSSLTLFGQEAGIANVGWFFMVMAIVMMVSRPAAGKIADRKGNVYALIPGAVFMAIGFLVLAISKDTIWLMASAIPYGIGFGSIQPALQAWTIYGVSPERRGSATATFFSAFDLGIGLGAFWVGFLAKWLPYSIIFKISVIFMLLFIAIYTIHLYRQRKRKQPIAANTAVR